MKSLNKFALVCALVVGIFIGLAVNKLLAAPDATVTNNSAAPFATLAVTTGSTKLIGVGENDVTIAHIGLQNDGATASVATDYVIVMISTASMSDVTTAGSKIYIPAGGSVTFRGFDLPFVAADNAHECIVQAYGHGAMLQIIKGSQFGSKQ